jgi:GrpB-like predicted nucleotidyltransferase (UPF0157 family)
MTILTSGSGTHQRRIWQYSGKREPVSIQSAAMEVRVEFPDPAWPAKYECEAQLLRAALNDIDVEVHHIGSTAIRGIMAKPVIDILLEVQGLGLLDARILSICKLGYESMGEFGIPGRRYFRKTSSEGVRTHQVHSFERGCANARRHLAFRDFMNSHPDAAREYSSLKLRLASAFPDDMRAYVSGKDSFVKRHESLALAWIADSPH